MTRTLRAAAASVALWAATWPAGAQAGVDAPVAPVAPVATASTPAASAPVASPPSAATSASGSSCPPQAIPLTADDAVAGMRDATDSGFLWKATRGGRTSYLYGTIHIAQRAWMFPGPHVLAALRASDVVALELDVTDPDVIARLQRALARKPGAPELPAALAARLRVQMAAACVEPASLSATRPEMRAVTLEVMAGRRLGLQPAYGVDVFLAGVAQGLRKPIRALETPEAQAALLVSDDPAETARSVEAVLQELESGQAPAILGRLAGDWRVGDLDDLARYGDWCECLKTPEQRADFRRLIADRNPLMADKIAQWHEEGSSLFVAVGSLHMIGEAGLPQLLKARGFDVERVAFDTPR